MKDPLSLSLALHADLMGSICLLFSKVSLFRDFWNLAALHINHSQIILIAHKYFGSLTNILFCDRRGLNYEFSFVRVQPWYMHSRSKCKEFLDVYYIGILGM